jgi:nicotinamide-nucleotide amidase
MSLALFPCPALETIRDFMIGNGQKVSAAESVSSGFLQAAFSSVVNASQFYEGGMTTFSIPQKVKHLGVNEAHAMACNAVSEQVAVEMALGVAKKFGTEWGLSLTGYATPVPESSNQVYAFFAIVHNNVVVCCKKIEAEIAEPAQLQLFYVERVLDELAACVAALAQVRDLGCR